MSGDTAKNSGQLFLERAEGVLFENFVQDICAGEYDRAGQLLGFMERLSLI